MVVFLGDKYEVQFEDGYIRAIERRNRRSVLYIPEKSPYYNWFEAELNESLNGDAVVERCLKNVGEDFLPAEMSICQTQ